jgi:hypothetical protein
LKPQQKMYIRLIFFISIIYLSGLNIQAQEEPKIGIGFNISNNLTNFILGNYSNNGGICIEPILLYKINDLFDCKTIVGFSKISSKHKPVPKYEPNQEIVYENIGFYLKSGIYTGIERSNKLFRHSLGVSVVYSYFDEIGNYTISGNYFGDYHGKYEVRGQAVFFLEPSAEIYIFKSSKMAITTSFKFPIVLFKSISEKYPNYYIPEYGQNETDYEVNLNYVLYRIDFNLIIPIK